jgi:hypothetical protein
MKRIFFLVAQALLRLARATNLTYNEINIIVYYLLIPLSWAILCDCIIRLPITTILLLLAWGFILWKKRTHFKEWCDDVSVRSQDFLLLFRKIGWNYEVSSVIICVIVPILVFAILIWLL